MAVQGIDNIGICTTDLARSAAFYDKLGFTEAYRNERGKGRQLLRKGAYYARPISRSARQRNSGLETE
jgi:catechol 2,3-dioxygenase-like lactoylglutathione lyase family enzyme